jgi:hypothetical protein
MPAKRSKALLSIIVVILFTICCEDSSKNTEELKNSGTHSSLPNLSTEDSLLFLLSNYEKETFLGFKFGWSKNHTTNYIKEMLVKKEVQFFINNSSDTVYYTILDVQPSVPEHQLIANIRVSYKRDIIHNLNITLLLLKDWGTENIDDTTMFNSYRHLLKSLVSKYGEFDFIKGINVNEISEDYKSSLGTEPLNAGWLQDSVKISIELVKRFAIINLTYRDLCLSQILEKLDDIESARGNMKLN